MEINIEDLREADNISISVVGVGGGGCNAINHLSSHGVHSSIKLIAVNTDTQHLGTISAHKRVQIGEKTTKGLGAGMNPEKGKKSAEESTEVLQEALKDSRIVFVMTGLGGGTGTGAAPIVARVAKELGALTIAVATKPFRVEGRMREKVAEQGLKELKKEVDSIIVIPNERLRAIVSKSLGMKESLKLVDDVLYQAVNGISSIILNNSNGGLNVDYADLETIMQFKGLGLIGLGEADGENAAMEAIHQAIESPLLDNVSINGARGAIAHAEINESYPLSEVEEAFDFVTQQVDQDGESWVKTGWSYNNKLAPNLVKITLVITGFEKSLITESAPEEQNAQAQIGKIALKKVSGLDEAFLNQDFDQPAFLRNQRD